MFSRLHRDEEEDDLWNWSPDDEPMDRESWLAGAIVRAIERELKSDEQAEPANSFGDCSVSGSFGDFDINF